MMPAGFTPPESGRAKEALRYFGAAFAFLVCGLAALVANSGALASGDTSASAVVAGLHLLTLGWLSLSIFGALQIFMGVALGVNPSGRRLAPWARRTWIAGAALFALGLALRRIELIAPGILALGAGLALLSLQLVPALLYAKRGHLTRAYSAVALFSLWCAWSLGALAGLARGGWVPLGLPSGYFSAHVLIAAFGWVGAMIAGVGSHLVPMFALSKPTSSLPIKAALPFWAAIPLAGLLAAFHPAPWGTIAWSLAGAASLLWITQFALYLSHRLRKERDYGILMAAFATGFLALAWLVLTALRAPQAFVGVAVVGWLALFTLGIYHRVIPFLVWFMRFSSGIGRGRIPRVKELLDERLSLATAAFSVCGVLIWSAGLIMHVRPLVYLGSAGYLCGALACLGQLKPLLSDSAFRKDSPYVPSP